MFSLMLTRTPNPFQSVFSPVSHIQLVCMSRVAPTQVHNQAHFVLVMLYAPTCTHFSDLSTSLCKSSPPSVGATAPPNLVSSANLLRTSSSPCHGFVIFAVLMPHHNIMWSTEKKNYMSQRTSWSERETRHGSDASSLSLSAWQRV